MCAFLQCINVLLHENWRAAIGLAGKGRDVETFRHRGFVAEDQPAGFESEFAKIARISIRLQSRVVRHVTKARRRSGAAACRYLFWRARVFPRRKTSAAGAVATRSTSNEGSGRSRAPKRRA